MLNVKNANLSEPDFTDNDIRSVSQAIKSSYVSSFGKEIQLFEKEISKFTKCKYVVAVVNGTSALHLSLKLLGTKENDEIIMPSMSFIASANAISLWRKSTLC